MSKENKLTQERLKEVLHYCEDSGVFTRIKSLRKRDDDLKKNIGSKNKRGYISILTLGKRMYAHRLAWLYVHGALPNQIDHIDGNPSNNRIKNLREVTQSENMKNIKLSPHNKSGHCGVWWNKVTKNWYVSTHLDNKKIHIGVYVCKEKAIWAHKIFTRALGFHSNHGRS